MAYFGTSGQFGGWLNNPAFTAGKNTRLKPGGIGTSTRGNNTGYQLGDNVRGFGQPGQESPSYPQSSMAGLGSHKSSGMAGPVDQQAPPEVDKQAEGMDAMNDWMKELMGNNWRAKIGGADIALPDEYEAPEKWTPESAGIGQAQVDPMAVINAAKPGLQEQANRGFASAAQKAGGTGAMMGSGYAKALGGVARNAQNDLNKITMDTLFKSSENAANREQQSRQNALDRSQGTWGQTYGQDQDAWRTHGDWEQNQGRWGRDMEMNMIQRLLGQFAGGA